MCWIVLLLLCSRNCINQTTLVYDWYTNQLWLFNNFLLDHSWVGTKSIFSGWNCPIKFITMWTGNYTVVLDQKPIFGPGNPVKIGNNLLAELSVTRHPDHLSIVPLVTHGEYTNNCQISTAECALCTSTTVQFYWLLLFSSYLHHQPCPTGVNQLCSVHPLNSHEKMFWDGQVKRRIRRTSVTEVAGGQLLIDRLWGSCEWLEMS